MDDNTFGKDGVMVTGKAITINERGVLGVPTSVEKGD